MRDHTKNKPTIGKRLLEMVNMCCNICQSINHWTTQCPDRTSEEVTYVVDKLTLQNPTDLALQTLLSETWCCVLKQEPVAQYAE